MFEKVNPSHPDKIADRIAGALVDMAYRLEPNPRIAVEVLIGHGKCEIIAETSVSLNPREVFEAVYRIVGRRTIRVTYSEAEQDARLSANQAHGLRCGDNGIFKGMPRTGEQEWLSAVVKDLYLRHPFDGKYIIDGSRFIACQSNVQCEEILRLYPDAVVNPLGNWTGGIDVDTGATNRKLGSDMGDSVTGGGLHGKDLSKADVSVSIYVWLKAQKAIAPVTLSCAIGDETVDGKPYSEIVEIARHFIQSRGGFEKFAEWGLLD